LNMKSKFFLVQTDVFLSICIILMINSMQSVSVFSALRANAGHSLANEKILELRVNREGAISVTSGDTTCESALVTIHPEAPAGAFENQLNEFLADSKVKSVARVVGE